ncbi:hypothetical protein BJ165DRAFT_1505663 [Panaeolus papilionaceus]|nr:hypothetical protein BJ165DRAFT_1505663 [Panaeolus papilionaceus]
MVNARVVEMITLATGWRAIVGVGGAAECQWSTYTLIIGDETLYPPFRLILRHIGNPIRDWTQPPARFQKHFSPNNQAMNMSTRMSALLRRRRRGTSVGRASEEESAMLYTSRFNPCQSISSIDTLVDLESTDGSKRKNAEDHTLTKIASPPVSKVQLQEVNK